MFKSFPFLEPHHRWVSFSSTIIISFIPRLLIRSELLPLQWTILYTFSICIHFSYTAVIMPKNSRVFDLFQYLGNSVSQSLNGVGKIFTSVTLAITPKVFNVVKLTMKLRIVKNSMTGKSIRLLLDAFFNLAFLCHKIGLN